MSRTFCSQSGSRWLPLALLGIVLTACGGASSTGNTSNPTVAAQVQTLKPSNALDSVGVFVELETRLDVAAQNSTTTQAQLQALQQDFLAELLRGAQKPAAAGTSSCDLTQLVQRIASAYLPKSGAAARLELSGCELDLLPGMAIVKGVYPDMPMASQAIATNITGTTVSPVNVAVQYSFNGTTAWPQYDSKAADGEGFVVAVLDTGVEFNHPAIKGKLEKGACFSTPTSGGMGFCPSGTVDTSSANAGQSCVGNFGSRSVANAAGCGHGTNMAGIAAMNYVKSSSVAAGGVARSARILPVQVFTGGISGGGASIYANSGDLLHAIEWLTAEARRRNVNNLPRIASVNMSLGGGLYSSSCDSEFVGKLFKTAFDSLRAEGVIPVAAAGNAGNDRAISFPACVSNVVAVGATQLGSGQIAEYSNISPQVKVFAQGGDRGVAYNMPTTSNDPDALDAWVSGAGTSPAAAFVSGGVAVLRQLRPNASLTDIEAALQSSDKATTTDRTATTRAIPQLRLTAAAIKITGKAPDVVPAPPAIPEPMPPSDPMPDPSPVPEPVLMRLCMYSQINFSGDRACGIFAEGESISLAGSWNIRSIKYWTHAMDADLSTTTLPVVTLYSTLAASQRPNEGITIQQSEPNLTTAMPNSLVRNIRFTWEK